MKNKSKLAIVIFCILFSSAVTAQRILAKYPVGDTTNATLFIAEFYRPYDIPLIRKIKEHIFHSATYIYDNILLFDSAKKEDREAVAKLQKAMYTKNPVRFSRENKNHEVVTPCTPEEVAEVLNLPKTKYRFKTSNNIYVYISDKVDIPYVSTADYTNKDFAILSLDEGRYQSYYALDLRDAKDKATLMKLIKSYETKIPVAIKIEGKEKFHVAACSFAEIVAFNEKSANRYSY